MKINSKHINEYKQLMQTTDLQKDYQEFIKFFRGLRTYLSGSMSEYKFTGNIVENGMDYSYFQFTDTELQSKGLKIVIAFVHKEFVFEMWLSGMNRKIQCKFHTLLSNKKCKYELSKDPNRVDYIIKDNLIDDINYEEYEKLVECMRANIIEFTNNVKYLV
jgi:hypothetical protein